MSLTLQNIIDLARGTSKELNDKVWSSNLIKLDINLAQRKVQNDLLFNNLKSFNKEAILSGAIFAVPSDCSHNPNAIIDCLASNAGTRGSATIDYTTPTADLIFTAKEPGTTNIHIVTTGGSGTGNVGVSCAYTTYWTITVTFEDNDLTCNQILAVINADPVAGNLVTVTTTTGSAKPAPGESKTATLSAGTGANWYPAHENTIEEYNRIEENTYLASSTTSPAWTMKGDGSGTRMMYMQPNTVTFTKLHYKYVVADLVNTTDYTAIPAEFEDLLIKDVVRRGFERLEMPDKAQLVASEYDVKLKNLMDLYGIQLQANETEKTRIKTNDK